MMYVFLGYEPVACRKLVFVVLLLQVDLCHFHARRLVVWLVCKTSLTDASLCAFTRCDGLKDVKSPIDVAPLQTKLCIHLRRRKFDFI